MARYLLISAIAVVALMMLGAVGSWRVRANLLSRYSTVRSGHLRGARWVDVDRSVYEDWLAAIRSPKRETILTAGDAFSASFAALPDTGYSPDIDGYLVSPDIDGYLALLTSDLPEPESLSTLQLVRWSPLPFVADSPVPIAWTACLILPVLHDTSGTC